MRRFFAVPAVLAAAVVPFHSSVEPLSPHVRTELRQRGFWHHGCPVGLADLRVLTVSYHDRHGHPRTGQLVVNARAARPLRHVFRHLYRTHFPIRHMHFRDFYGTRAQRLRYSDVTASFECRQAVPSPCVGGTGTGSWSMHAYGLAVDVNPQENPYVGCGQSRDPRTRRYFDRSHHRPLMVTPNVVGAFADVGWGWGGSWAGSTKDYMHFSSTGH